MKYQQHKFTVGGNIYEDREAFRRNYDRMFPKKGEKDLSDSEIDHKGEISTRRGGKSLTKDKQDRVVVVPSRSK